MSILQLEHKPSSRAQAINALENLDGDRRPQFRLMRRMMIRFLESYDLRVKGTESAYGLACDLKRFMHVQARHSPLHLSELLNGGADWITF